MYLIRKISDCPLFLADRSKTKKFWWSHSLYYAFVFKSREVAETKKDSLKYGTFEVLTLAEAGRLRENADKNHQEQLERYSDRNFNPLKNH